MTFSPYEDGDRLYAAGLNALACPIGAVLAWLKSYTNTPALPAGWVECNGQTLSDTDSPYNGQTIPNLNASGGGTQRFLRGATSSGATGGEDTHALTVAELAAHTHDGFTMTTTAGSQSGRWAKGASGGTSTDNNSPSAGSGTAHENRPPFYEVVWVMRVH